MKVLRLARARQVLLELLTHLELRSLLLQFLVGRRQGSPSFLIFLAARLHFVLLIVILENLLDHGLPLVVSDGRISHFFLICRFIIGKYSLQINII